ncbi:hypothetical protein BH23PLA1_BH23PLA1_05160 [soil metagenome]
MFKKLSIAVLATTLMAPAVGRADGFSSLQESLIRIVAMSSIPSLADYDFDGTGCLFGYLLDEGAERGMVREFQAGRSYIILGAGDDDVIDMDIWITPINQPESRLVEDVEVDATPVIEFRPSRTGQYAINIQNYQSRGRGFCCFVVLEQRPGKQVGSGLMSLAEALDNSIELARIAGLFFANEFPSNNLVLFGGKFDQGQSSYTYDLSYPQGDYVVVATGSKAIDDVDLFVARQHQHRDRNGIRMAQDDEVDNTPMCEFSVFQNQYYCIEMKNYSGQKPGFIFGFVLRND